MVEKKYDVVLPTCEMMKRLTIHFEKSGKHNCILHSEGCEKGGQDQQGDFKLNSGVESRLKRSQGEIPLPCLTLGIIDNKECGRQYVADEYFPQIQLHS